MSDSQVLFSTAVRNVTAEEKAWLEALLKDKEQSGGVGFEWSFEQAADDSTYLYVHADTVFGGDIEQLAEFAQAFLAEWRPDGTFRVEYAIVETDFDAFSGGVVIITATGQRWFRTHQMLMLDQVERLIRRALEHAETMATQFDGTANPYLEVGNSILAEELLIPLNEALKTLGLPPSELWRQAEQAQTGEE